MLVPGGDAWVGYEDRADYQDWQVVDGRRDDGGLLGLLAISRLFEHA